MCCDEDELSGYHTKEKWIKQVIILCILFQGQKLNQIKLHDGKSTIGQHGVLLFNFCLQIAICKALYHKPSSTWFSLLPGTEAAIHLTFLCGRTRWSKKTDALEQISAFVLVWRTQLWNCAKFSLCPEGLHYCFFFFLNNNLYKKPIAL